MNRHFKTNHLNAFPHICGQCDEKFRRKLQLKKHAIQKHSKSYPHTCPQCQKGFLNTFSLTRHLSAHNEINRKQCPDCKMIFPKWSLLVEHRRQQHKSDQRFACDICQKTFYRKVNIKQHMQLHLKESREEVFQCQYENCPKFYTELRNLTAHVRSKHEGKRWTCDLCNRELATKQKMVQHIRAHLDVDRSKRILKKKSTMSRLVGLELPQEVEHRIIDGEGAQFIIGFPDSAHETSATELSDF